MPKVRDIVQGGVTVGQVSFPDTMLDAEVDARMAAYNSPISVPLEDELKERVLKAMKFGQELMAEFGVMNILSGKTNQEIGQLSQALSPVQALLLAGALHTAKDWINSEAAASVTLETRTYFLQRIDAFLAGAV